MHYIPFEKTVKDIQKLLRPSVYTGKLLVNQGQIIEVIQHQRIFDTEKLKSHLIPALVSSDEKHNIIDGDGSACVIITLDKLNQIFEIIDKEGGILDEQSE